MLKFKKVIQKIEKDELDKAYCDFCKQKFDYSSTNCRDYDSITIKFDYGNMFDDKHYHLKICVDCFVKLFVPKIKKLKKYFNIKK